MLSLVRGHKAIGQTEESMNHEDLIKALCLIMADDAGRIAFFSASLTIDASRLLEVVAKMPQARPGVGGDECREIRERLSTISASISKVSIELNKMFEEHRIRTDGSKTNERTNH